jgi:hypothetical protein
MMEDQPFLLQILLQPRTQKGLRFHDLLVKVIGKRWINSTCPLFVE